MADTYDFEIEQGATFQREIIWTNASGEPSWVDPSGWTGIMKIRPGMGVSAITSLDNSYGLTFAASGSLTINIPASATSLFSFTKAIYDLKVTSPVGVVTRLLEGEVVLDEEVSS